MKRANEIRVCFHFSAPALCNVEQVTSSLWASSCEKEGIEVFVKKPFSSTHDPKGKYHHSSLPSSEGSAGWSVTVVQFIPASAPYLQDRSPLNMVSDVIGSNRLQTLDK